MVVGSWWLVEVGRRSFSGGGDVPRKGRGDLFCGVVGEVVVDHGTLKVVRLMCKTVILYIFTRETRVLSSPPSIKDQVFLLLDVYFPFICNACLLYAESEG